MNSIHPSQRGWFANELYKMMKEDPNIWLLVGDLGFKVFDKHFEDFPNRCLNVGASEQAMLGIACGLALRGKIPVVYSITPFLIYRPFETIRTYINHEQIPVKLVGSGRDDDYKHDGFSHDAKDIKKIMDNFENICQDWPETKEEIPDKIHEFLYCPKPHFLSLRR